MFAVRCTVVLANMASHASGGRGPNLVPLETQQGRGGTVDALRSGARREERKTALAELQPGTRTTGSRAVQRASKARLVVANAYATNWDDEPGSVPRVRVESALHQEPHDPDARRMFDAINASDGGKSVEALVAQRVHGNLDMQSYGPMLHVSSVNKVLTEGEAVAITHITAGSGEWLDVTAPCVHVSFPRFMTLVHLR